jgi:hypothetical protein
MLQKADRRRRRTMDTNSSWNDADSAGQVGIDIRHLTAQQLAQLGVSQIAYVRPVIVNGQRGFAIHGADGTPMAVAGDQEVAFAAILQQDMVPAWVH